MPEITVSLLSAAVVVVVVAAAAGEAAFQIGLIDLSSAIGIGKLWN